MKVCPFCSLRGSNHPSVAGQVNVSSKCVQKVWKSSLLRKCRCLCTSGWCGESQGCQQRGFVAVSGLSMQLLPVSLTLGAVTWAAWCQPGPSADLMEAFCCPFVPVASAFAAGPLPGSALQGQPQQLIKNCWCERNNQIFFRNYFKVLNTTLLL